MEIAVVILNWNGRSYLEQFLPSVIKYSNEATIYVADNNSTDDSLSFLQDNYPEIKIVINKKNGGYAKGYNDALKKINADYFVLLNSDVEVTENWIAPVIDVLNSNENIVAVQPKILSFQNKDRFEYAGAAGGYLDRNYYPFCKGRMFNSFEKDLGQYNKNTEVFWASGACLFIEADTFKGVGGFDEDFFAHMEEIDLCWRLKNLGHQIMYCGSSTVYHVGGGTLSKINPLKTYLNFRNNLYIVLKNYRGKNILGILLYRNILDGIAGIKFLLEGKPNHFFAVIKAHFSFYFSLRKFIQKRKRLRNIDSSTVPNNVGYYKKSAVWRYFVMKKTKFSDLDQSNFI